MVCIIWYATLSILSCASDMVGLVQAGQILGDMAAVYFVSVAAIVAAFYGKEAITAQKKNSISASSSKKVIDDR